ncbi:MAG TPA: ATP-binding protein [Verrucomicrobiae bacterium]|jgi:PAS domain S-box-containing protein|nr:ATP-binding protein [Verrucomicrobiae bacterium]
MEHPAVEKNLRILVVDDNPAVHEDFRKILCPPSSKGAEMRATEKALFGEVRDAPLAPAFSVESALQGEEGLARAVEAQRKGVPFALAFIDVRMPPGWDGIETTVRIWEKCPDLEVVICTAYSDYSLDQMLSRVRNEEQLVILKKPFETIEVLQLANALTGKWRLRQEAHIKLDVLDKMVRERTSDLREANTRLGEQARLLDLARDAIIVWDLEGRARYWNKSAELLYGWTAAEAIGAKVAERYCRGPKALEKELKAWQAVASGEWNGELRHVSKSGKDILVQSRWTLVRDSQGNPQAVLVINTDITERKELEMQFWRAQRMDSIGTLAGGIAHDLNNILAPILMIGPLLRAQIDDPSMAALIESMEHGAERGANIVKQILTFSRGGGGKKAPLQIHRLLKQVTAFIKDTFPKSIHAQLIAPRDLWMVEGNSAELHQVLMNLCVNSREAMPDGGALKIEAQNVILDDPAAANIPNARPGRYVMLRVNDTGSGIAAEHMNRIFDPFFTTKEVGKGPGLGLSTVLGIVTASGGSVQARSDRGKGAEFVLYLPALTESLATTPATPYPEPSPGPGELIMVVEEDSAVGAILETILITNGYRVLLTGDGDEAMELYHRYQKEIDAVLADATLEAANGKSVVHALNDLDPSAKLIPTSDVSEDQLPTLPHSLATHLLRKPCQASMVLETLRSVLDKPA